MSKPVKQRAIDLRKNGWSYNIISTKLGVPKSTLSHWLRDLPYTPNNEVKKRIKEGPAKSSRVRHQARIQRTRNIKRAARNELGILSQRDIWMIGLGLYIGDGTKAFETIRIINSDPNIIRTGIVWFREACGLKIENLRLSIHIYPDISEKEALKYWSDVTNIPIKQFDKTYLDERKNKSETRKRKLVCTILRKS